MPGPDSTTDSTTNSAANPSATSGEARGASAGPAAGARKARGAVARGIGSFHPASMPMMARANYRRELVAASLLPFALAIFEGGVLGVLLKNGFEGVAPRAALSAAVALVTTAPAIGNLTSFLWAPVWHGQPLARAIALMQAMVAILCGTMALAPATTAGMWMMAAGAVAARSCWAGVITLRSTAWGQNYPRRRRARITSKFATIQVLGIALLGLGMGWAVDQGAGGAGTNWTSFRILAVLGAIFGLGGALSWSRVRIRGERALQEAERVAGAARRSLLHPGAMIRTLREDRAFGGYMLWMFLLGSGNLMIGAPLALIVADRFGMGNLAGIAATASIPYLMVPIMIPLWARLLEATHIIRFRVIHSWVFVAANVSLLVAALAGNLWLLYLSAIIKGIAFAGGALAWNLGHLDFAPPHKASHYMGVHVTLTGVRGVMMPFIGVVIYEWLQAEASAYGGGAWVFALCSALTIGGAIGFMHLSRRVDPRLRPHHGPLEVAPPSRVE